MSATLAVKVTKLRQSAILPDYQTEQAAGMDLHACIEQSMTLKPLERAVVPTGLALELPVGYEAQIRARSGLSIKYGLAMVNGVGTIDSDYRGEIGIPVINLGTDSFTIEPDMRLAQMVVARYERVVWHETASLTETARGIGGYGSTDAPIDRIV
ncbi:MAG: dUTP diphosphatase [Candidatus Saccharibacteria bacterium]